MKDESLKMVNTLVTICNKNMATLEGHFDRLLWANAKEGLEYILQQEAAVEAPKVDVPKDFDEFLEMVTDTFVRKNTDYGCRYTKALIEYGSVIWRWEVEKKLDRIRSWITRGELLVKGEGVNNSVQDLYNYTILYELLFTAGALGVDPYSLLTEKAFRDTAELCGPPNLIAYLEGERLVEPEETELKSIIRKYMGESDER